MRFGLVGAHVRATTLELARYPGYTIPTLLFPSMFFLFFAAPHAGPHATLSMCSFAAFAVIGVGLFQFGVAAAADRVSPWERYVRTLPLSTGTRFAARVVSAGAFATASAFVVVVAALVATPAGLSAAGFAELGLVLLGSLVPFGLLGIALGYLATPRSAVPLANLVYLVSAYAGGLWIRPSQLPGWVEQVSPVLPTRRVADLSAGVAGGSPWSASAWGVLGLWSLAFALLAWGGYRRDEGQRFR